jgi:hypothetical protein
LSVANCIVAIQCDVRGVLAGWQLGHARIGHSVSR